MLSLLRKLRRDLRELSDLALLQLLGRLHCRLLVLGSSLVQDVQLAVQRANLNNKNKNKRFEIKLGSVLPGGTDRLDLKVVSFTF